MKMRLCIGDGDEEKGHCEQITKEILLECVQGSVLILGTHLVCAPPCAGAGCQGQEGDAPMSIGFPATPHFPESGHMLSVWMYSPLLLAASSSISPTVPTSASPPWDLKIGWKISGSFFSYDVGALSSRQSRQWGGVGVEPFGGLLVEGFGRRTRRIAMGFGTKNSPVHLGGGFRCVYMSYLFSLPLNLGGGSYKVVIGLAVTPRRKCWQK